MRTSEALDGHCVGTATANMWHNGGRTEWSLTSKPGWTKIDCRVYAGDQHVATFQEGDPPPFYQLDAPLRDREQTDEEVRAVENRRAAARAKKAGRGRGRGRGTDQGGGRGRGRTAAAPQPPETEGVVAAGTKFKKVFDEGTFDGIVLSYDAEAKLYSVRYSDGDQEDLDAAELEGYMGTGIIPGYIDKPKGMQQYLWERGLYFETKMNPSCEHQGCLKKGQGCPMLTAVNPKKPDLHKRDHSYCMKTVLGNCRDFAMELSALEQKFIDRGHTLIMSPKGHPELAGKGIEFSWGVSKKYFRKINNCKGKDLHDNIYTSFEVLDLPQARRNSRRTRRYRAAYDTAGKSEEQLATSFALVEKFCRDHKAHRNILDQDTKEIKAVLARNGIIIY